MVGEGRKKRIGGGTFIYQNLPKMEGEVDLGRARAG
jgi:hypothetical protein